MLARHAEGLFWVGRYLERTENTVRLLDVTHTTLLEGGLDRGPDDLWAELLEVLYLDDAYHGGWEARQVEHFLLADPGHGGSVVTMISRARDNARSSREWLSTEFWEATNDLHLDLTRGDLSEVLASGGYDVLRRIRLGCQAIAGVGAASLPRTDGYRYLFAGVALERAMITVRVLSAWQSRLGGFGGPAAYPEWLRLLKSLSAHEAYVRAHRAVVEPRRVLGFLLQADDLPRSLLHSLRRLESQVASVANGHVGQTSLRAVGRVRSTVEFAEPSGLAPLGLEAFLAEVEAAIGDLHRVIERDFFRAGAGSMYASETL